MEPIKEKVKEFEPPKDALDFKFEEARKRALTTPIIKDGQNVAAFVERYEAPPYYIAIGLVVQFLYDTAYGSYYPFWVLQVGFVTKEFPKPRNVKFSFLTDKRINVAVDMAHRHLEAFERTSEPKAVQMGRTPTDYSWSVPLSENEVGQLAEVYQSLIRRTI